MASSKERPKGKKIGGKPKPLGGGIGEKAKKGAKKK